MSKVPVDKKENFSNTSFKRLNIGMIVSYYVNFKANFWVSKIFLYNFESLAFVWASCLKINPVIQFS